MGKKSEIKQKLVTWRSSFAHPRSSHQRVIDTHHFNFKTEIIVPGAENAEKVARALKPLESFHYYLFKGHLNQLLTSDFINKYMKGGKKFYAVSVGSHSDASNAVAILPDGWLVMHLDKDTKEQLGLDAKPSSFRCNHGHMFVVEVNLLAPSFVPSKKLYKRVQWALGERSAPVQLVVACVDEDGLPVDVDLPSAEGAFSKKMTVKCSKFAFKNVFLPNIENPAPTFVDVPKATTSISDPDVDSRAESSEKSNSTTNPKKKSKIEIEKSKTTMQDDEDEDLEKSDSSEESSNGEESDTGKSEKSKKRRRTAATAQKDPLHEDARDQEMLRVFDWLGLVACRFNKAISAPPTTEVPECGAGDAAGSADLGLAGVRGEPVNDREATKCALFVMSFKGFVPPVWVHRAVQAVRGVIASPDADPLHWGGVLTQGYPDSPVSWGRYEHGYLQTGENDFSFVVFPDDRYWLLEALGPHDVYS